jgi:hypothetical protein
MRASAWLLEDTMHVSAIYKRVGYESLRYSQKKFLVTAVLEAQGQKCSPTYTSPSLLLLQPSAFQQTMLSRSPIDVGRK